MSFKCTVCWELLSIAVEHTGGGPGSTDVTATKCGHLYHTVCLQGWLRTQNNAGCPTCRAGIRLKDCLKLYPSRDQGEEETSKVTKMKNIIEKLERILDLKQDLLTLKQTQFDSLKTKLDKTKNDLDVMRSMKLSLFDQITILKKEKKSLEKLVKESEEQCTGLENRLAESEAKCMRTKEEFELAKRFTDANTNGIIQGLSLSRDSLRQELRDLYVQLGGIINTATRMVEETDGFIAHFKDSGMIT